MVEEEIIPRPQRVVRELPVVLLTEALVEPRVLLEVELVELQVLEVPEGLVVIQQDLLVVHWLVVLARTVFLRELMDQ